MIFPALGIASRGIVSKVGKKDWTGLSSEGVPFFLLSCGKKVEKWMLRIVSSDNQRIIKQPVDCVHY